jgi:magnesium-protoporphyrin O-methyltransferase
MECCAHCQDSGDIFDDANAKKELRKYRKSGLNKKSGRLLVEGLQSLDVEGASVLDIGGGIGTVPFELFEAGASSATLVEASRPFLEVATDEARRRGLSERMETRFGDVVEMADELHQHDIVTLDRVICCYPDMEALVAASTSLAGRFYGVVYPKNLMVAPLFKAFADGYCRLKQMDFRIHFHEGVDEEIRSHGFEPFYEVTTWLWRVKLYERMATGEPA